MKIESFTDSLVGLRNLAKASGLPDRDAAFSLLCVALAVADANSIAGCSRDDFMKMAGVVHDRLRSALSMGRSAG